MFPHSPGVVLAAGKRLPQGGNQVAGKADALDVQRLRLRRELRDHDFIRGVYEKVLAVNAEAKEQRALPALHVLLRPVVDRNAWIV